MFERVVGVELDPGTYREAVAAHSDPCIEIECGDMFPFVDKICAGSKLYSGRGLLHSRAALDGQHVAGGDGAFVWRAAR